MLGGRALSIKKGRKECRQLKEFKDIGTQGGKSEIKVQV